jgi:anti-anti-sigma factor
MSDIASVKAETRDDTTVVFLRGEIDMANAADIHSDILAVSGDGPCVIIDLSGVTYLDSAGVRLVSDLLRRFHDEARTLLFAIPKEATCRRVLELTLPDLPVVGTTE